MRINSWSDYLYILFSAIIFAVILRWLFISFYIFPSQSMTPTFAEKSIVIVNKAAYGIKLTPGGKAFFSDMPKRGDLILFVVKEKVHLAAPEAYYVRRVIAVENESIEIKAGRVFVDDRELGQKDLASPPIGASSQVYQGPIQEEKWNESLSWIKFKVFNEDKVHFPRQKIPEGHVFVLSDYRVGFEDSRDFGMIPLQNIEGKVIK
ncbi:MAG: signal peptidase I [Bacteriovoracaceae bacterium]|nr:signal peptidase I [Bacteriovoracaceae bacterium]NUM57060.1 signal peptidase I [Pseudobdellovibrionaceae bacterium]